MTELKRKDPRRAAGTGCLIIIELGKATPEYVPHICETASYLSVQRL